MLIVLKLGIGNRNHRKVQDCHPPLPTHHFGQLRLELRMDHMIPNTPTPDMHLQMELEELPQPSSRSVCSPEESVSQQASLG